MPEAPLADMPLMWRCTCGVRSFNHHGTCSACGAVRPEPPPPPPPGDTVRQEAWIDAVTTWDDTPVEF